MFEKYYAKLQTGFSWLAYCPVTGYFEEDNTMRGSIKGAEFINQLTISVEDAAPLIQKLFNKFYGTQR